MDAEKGSGMKALILLWLGICSSLSYAECTSRANESELSYSQIMYHFGRATRIAGMTAMKGSTTVEALDAARAVLSVGIECAELSLADTTGRLKPKKAQALSGPEREAYLAKADQHMRRFMNGLLELRALYCASELSSEEFARIVAKEREITGWVNEAHSDLL